MIGRFIVRYYIHIALLQFLVGLVAIASRESRVAWAEVSLVVLMGLFGGLGAIADSWAERRGKQVAPVLPVVLGTTLPAVVLDGETYRDVMYVLRKARAGSPDYGIDAERLAARVLERRDVIDTMRLLEREADARGLS